MRRHADASDRGDANSATSSDSALSVAELEELRAGDGGGQHIVNAVAGLSGGLVVRMVRGVR